MHEELMFLGLPYDLCPQGKTTHADEELSGI
jgi:hypothetical protein